jgi:PAS domain S-box-containing protein
MTAALPAWHLGRLMSGERPVTILNVDDNDAVRYVKTRQLTEAGFRVVEAATGRDALRMARSLHPDLVLLDVKLPDISGFEVCHILRSEEGTRFIPIVHLTATHLETEMLVLGLETGADSYLTAPVEPAVLVATVRAMIRARRAEEDLSRSQRALDDLFESAPIGLCLVSPEGILLRMNRAQLDILGMERDHCTGKPISCFHADGPHADGRDEGQIEELMGRLAQGQTIYDEEAIFRAADGSLRDVLISANGLFEDGRYIHSRWFIRDITDRKRAEAALRHSEQRFRAMAETVPDFIFTCRPDGDIEYISNRFCQYTGLSAESINKSSSGHSPWQQFIHPQDVDRITREWNAALRRAQALQGAREPQDLQPCELQLRLRAADGSYRWFLARARPVLEAHIQRHPRASQPTRPPGAPGATLAPRWVGAITDIDDLVRAEERLQVQARELLRSNSDLEDFAYIASHDLKEPLRGINNYAHFLLEDYESVLDEAGRSKLLTLKRLAQRLDSLIGSLMEYSRLGRTELAVGDTDLNHIVATVTDSLSATLDEEHAKVILRGPLPRIRCDSVRIAEVFRNLIVNGIKYNQSEQKVIEIAALDAGAGPPELYEPPPELLDLHDSHDPHDSHSPYVRTPHVPLARPPQVVLSIRDNGIGIQRKHFATIFRMFKRLHGRDEFGGGTGSGLAIVTKIIERHGGRIAVESQPGEGSTFYIRL